MQTDSIFVVEFIAAIGQRQLYDLALRQIRGLIEHQTSVDDLGFQCAHLSFVAPSLEQIRPAVGATTHQGAA
jgi:hypothetical protein